MLRSETTYRNIRPKRRYIITKRHNTQTGDTQDCSHSISATFITTFICRTVVVKTDLLLKTHSWYQLGIVIGVMYGTQTLRFEVWWLLKKCVSVVAEAWKSEHCFSTTFKYSEHVSDIHRKSTINDEDMYNWCCMKGLLHLWHSISKIWWRKKIGNNLQIWRIFRNFTGVSALIP